MLIFKKEKKVAKLVEAHINVVAECLATATRAVEQFLVGELAEAKELAKRVDQIETNADRVRREIRDDLYLGAFLPLIREDVYKLVETIDKVANAAEECCDFFLSQRPDVPAEMRDAFVEITEASFGSFVPLGKAAHVYFKPKGKIEAVRELAQKVGEQESVVDTQEWELTRRIFDSTLESLSHKMHLRRALDKIVQVSDRAEDAADQLELVSVKSVI